MKQKGCSSQGRFIVSRIAPPGPFNKSLWVEKPTMMMSPDEVLISGLSREALFTPSTQTLCKVLAQSSDSQRSSGKLSGIWMFLSKCFAKRASARAQRLITVQVRQVPGGNISSFLWDRSRVSGCGDLLAMRLVPLQPSSRTKSFQIIVGKFWKAKELRRMHVSS